MLMNREQVKNWRGLMAVGLAVAELAAPSAAEAISPPVKLTKEPIFLTAAGDVKVYRQQGVSDGPEHVLRYANIKKAARLTANLGKLGLQVPLVLKYGPKTETFGFNTVLSRVSEHEYYVLRDKKTMDIVSGSNTATSRGVPAFTKIHEDINLNKTYFEPIEKRSRLTPKTTAAATSLYTETCNNELGVEPTQQTWQVLSDPTTPATVATTLRIWAYERFCNSFGLMAALKEETNTTYNQYVGIARTKNLGRAITGNLTVPYHVFSKAIWNKT